MTFLNNGDGVLYQQLPGNVLDMLVELKASPRLIAHLTLVHDAAWKLTHQLNIQFPGFCFDREAVLYGAAVHDIGKTAIPAELSEPGSLHEKAGFDLLCKRGIDRQIALFAHTHSDWQNNRQIENLLVSAADKLWKGKRDSELEDLILDRLLSNDCGKNRWKAFIALDEMWESLAADAANRLAYQTSYPL
jgi:HD superfamily phosphodiesterase